MKPEPESMDDCEDFYASPDHSDTFALMNAKGVTRPAPLILGFDLAGRPDTSVKYLYDPVKEEFTPI